MATTTEAQAQFNTLTTYLREVGLDQLFTVDSQGNPGGWLWNQMQSGVDSPDELRRALEQTDVYRDRYAVIIEQRKRAAEGGAGYVMSESEVLEYEQTVKQRMAQAGLPSTFYDEPKDFHKLILSNMSAVEVGERITQAYDYVLSSPPEVRQAFDDFYGVGQGDANLAAWALDSDRTLLDVNRATRTAYSAGMAERFDIGIDRATAERIADLPQTEAGITEGLRQVASMSRVFTEGIGEAGDLTSDDGVATVFEGDANSQTAINRRIGERRSIERSSTGGALITSDGVLGAGSS